MEDRRNFARIDHQHLVSYTQRDADDSKDDEGMAKTLNLSAEGLLLLFPSKVEADARLELELNLDGSIVKVVGHVVRSSPDPDKPEMFDVGIALDHVPGEFVETVERYLAKADTARV